MGTLPRTKSLSGTEGRNLTLNLRRDRKRPSSICESYWNRVDLGPAQGRLCRTPSQANNLCTTVPTSLVPRNLGRRHMPTKTSLKHSRNLVMSKYPADKHKQRWKRAGGVGRVSILVITAQIFVGAVGVSLAMWLLHWASSLSFRELPHYAGALVCFSGILAAVLKNCFTKHNNWPSSIIKVILAIFLMLSIVSCFCVCVFASLHLINLAPMECRSRNDVITHPVSNLSREESVFLSRNSVEIRKPTINPYKGLMPSNLWKYNNEGSGSGPYTDDEMSDDDSLYPDEVVSGSVTNFDPRITKEILVNTTVCVCEKRRKGWRFVLNYPNLSCAEVKNILPIFFVASCVVTIVGGVLSSVILYMLWVSRRNPFGSYGRPLSASETSPFIYKSNFKNGFATNRRPV